MMKSISGWLAMGHVLLLANAQQLPYNPTSVFLAPNEDVAYILHPSSSDAANGELLSLNISASIEASQVSPTVLTKDLPFLEQGNGGDGVSFVAAMAKSGDIGVYAGSCSSNSSVWRYSNTSVGGTRAWEKVAISESATTKSSELPNANFLAAGLYFSTVADADVSRVQMYLLGGMCPTTASVNITTWQAAANYSNTMLKISPPTSSSNDAQYTVSVSSGDGGPKPIPEAGHTITGLVPTYSNTSTGIVTQAQTYVLIGGHTSGAFIGMDRVGLFSLPDETWTFQSIDTRTVVGGSELAVIRASDSTMPDSRSGHTALLSPDGSKIIIFGGWVGDVDTPADPQLLVLQIGSGFGGSGDWAWEIPSASGTGLDKGEGVYGHGAVMLSGGVMMVVGGNKISSINSNVKRADSLLQTSLLNTTSMTWVDSYTNPSLVATGSASPGSASPSSDNPAGSSAPDGDDKSKKVKIGVGAGIGGLAVIVIAILCIWYGRKAHAKRVAERHQKLIALGKAAHREGLGAFYGPYNGDMVERRNSQSLGNRSMGMGYGNNHNTVYDPLSQGGGYDYEEDKNQSYVVPTQRNSFTIPRKPTNSRNARGYSQPPMMSTNQYSSFDFGTNQARANSLGTAGTIHPIYEADEDNDIADADLLNVGQAVDYPPASSNDHSDPFTESQPGLAGLTPSHQLRKPRSPRPLDRNTPTPESSAKEREREVEEWVADWNAAEALMGGHSRSQSLTQTGRLSPGKDSASNSGRTASNLSEQSVVTLSRSGSHGTRSNSLTAFFSGSTAWNPFASNAGPSSGTVGRRVEYVQGVYAQSSGRLTAEGYYTNGSISPASDQSGGTLMGPPKSAGSGSNSGGSASFVTAHSGTNFPALRAEAETLLPRPGSEQWEPGSPSKSKGLKKPPGWLGSLKKVFGQEEWVSGPGVEDEGERYVDSPSPTRPTFGNEPYRDDDTGPKRTASAGAMLWRRKQGREDWEDSAEDERAGGRRPYSVAGLETILPDDEEEWDVEKAVRGRVVQVMFTVPKEKLRVVNQDEGIEDDESDIGMQGSPARSPARSPTRERQEEQRRTERAAPSTPVSKVASPRTPSPSKTPVSSRSTSPTKSLRGKKVQEIVEQMERREGM